MDFLRENNLITPDRYRLIDQKKRELLNSDLQGFMEKSRIGKKYWSVIQERIIPLKIVNGYIESLGENIRDGKGMILSGGIGIGKTTILSYIAQKARLFGSYVGTKNDDDKFEPLMWEGKYKIRFRSVSMIFSLIFGKKEIELSDLETCDLLLLDDFGREYSAEFPVSIFEDFIESRYANMRATCVTTNLSIKQLRGLEKYARIIDRFAEDDLFQFVEIAGESQRGLE